jgi:hypothetical protein
MLAVDITDSNDARILGDVHAALRRFYNRVLPVVNRFRGERGREARYLMHFWALKIASSITDREGSSTEMFLSYYERYDQMLHPAQLIAVKNYLQAVVKICKKAFTEVVKRA